MERAEEEHFREQMAMIEKMEEEERLKREEAEREFMEKYSSRERSPRINDD